MDCEKNLKCYNMPFSFIIVVVKKNLASCPTYVIACEVGLDMVEVHAGNKW